MSEKRYETVLMSTDDIESLKKYQEKYGVNVLSTAPHSVLADVPTQPVSLPSGCSICNSNNDVRLCELCDSLACKEHSTSFIDPKDALVCAICNVRSVSNTVILSRKMTKLREDHEELKKKIEYIESSLSRLLFL